MQELMLRNKNFRWQALILKNLQKATKAWVMFYFQNWYIFHDFFSRTYANQFTDILQISIHADRKIIMTRNMHFITRFYNKHNIDLALSNVIESNDRRIEEYQREEFTALNVEQYESDHEKNANERATRLHQQTMKRVKRAKRKKRSVILNDDDDEEEKKTVTKAKTTINWNDR